MVSRGEGDKNTPLAVGPLVVDAVPLLNSEAAQAVDADISTQDRLLQQEIAKLQEQRRALQVEKRKKQRTQERAFSRLRPALQTLPPYKANKAVVAFSVEEYSQPYTVYRNRKQCIERETRYRG